MKGKVLMYGRAMDTVPNMIKRQVCFRQEEFELLQAAAQRSGRSVSGLVREAVRRVWLHSMAEGPVALWDGPTAHSAMDHDTTYDQVE